MAPAERVLRDIGKYEASDLIPLLQRLQDVYGYLPPKVLKEVCGRTGISPSQMYGVITFYAQFHLTRQGKHRIKVCRGTACHVRGSGRIMEAVKKKLGIRPGQTTPDYKFSLERVACFGSCALAPVMVVNGKVYGRMSPQKAERILESLE